MSTNQENLSQSREFKYGRSLIEYQLVYEKRSNLAITVKPDKSILVKAPITSEFQEVQKKLKKRGRWILKQINYFDKFHPKQPEREYVSGETHYYLGRQYRLRIRKGKEEEIKLKGKFFIAKTMRSNDREYIKSLIMEWYANHAQMLIDRRIKYYAEKILGKGYRQLKTRYIFMKSRWGSCDTVKGINFNIELVKTPIQCIDYVIVHELCHIVHPNHDKAFYRVMGKIMPDCKERKEKLELFAGKL
ncbi:MAG: M48 family metallopeptidase [Candidatus Hodarchaeales archaeon]